MSSRYDYGLNTFDELRDRCEYKGDADYDPNICECPVCNAILEIQYLQSDVSKWQSIAEQLVESDPRFEAFHRYFREVFPR